MAELGLINTQDEIEELEGFETDEVKQAWKIKDLAGADWCFEKLQLIDNERDERITFAKSQIEKYEKFIEQEKKIAENRGSYFKWKLQEYLQERRQSNPNYAIKTTKGKVNVTTPTVWNYDDKKLLEFLKTNELPEFIRIKEEINKVDLKKAVQVTDSGDVVTQDGEIIEGVKVTNNEKINIKY